MIWRDKAPPSPADQFPDQAGIAKHNARYSSLVKKTTFAQNWAKPLPKIGEQFHACVSCQERWGRETLPHAVTNRYPMQPDPQTLNDSFTVSPAKKANEKKPCVERYQCPQDFLDCFLVRYIFTVSHLTEKGNKKAPALRVQGRSFFDLFRLCTITRIVYYNFKLTSTNCWYLQLFELWLDRQQLKNTGKCLKLHSRTATQRGRKMFLCG